LGDWRLCRREGAKSALAVMERALILLRSEVQGLINLLRPESNEWFYNFFVVFVYFVVKKSK